MHYPTICTHFNISFTE